MVPRERLGDLARDPLRGRVCRHAKRHPKSSSMAYDDKTIEDLERDRWQDKEVDRRDAVGMVAEKRPPALRRWPRVAAHIPSDRRLGDLEAELEQLTMNAWRAPKRVRTAHLANERAQLSRDLRSANTVARSPAPIRPKPSTVPANDRLRPDNRNRAKDGGKPAIEPNKQKTIGIVEVRSLRRPPAKHIDLLPQDQVFRFQRCSRLEARSQDTENQLEQIVHQMANLPRLFSASMLNRIFGTHRLWSLLLVPLFGWACVRAARQSQPLLLLYAAPAIVMLGLHAAVANQSTRYNLILIGPFSVGAAWIISATLRNARWRSRALAPGP